MRLAAHGRRTASSFGLEPQAYRDLQAFQNGLCAICQKAKGNQSGERGKRNLAVDHDHTCCSGPTSCGRCVRGLLCGPCNDVLAHFRDDGEALMRAVLYLQQWPSRLKTAGGSWPPASLSP